MLRLLLAVALFLPLTLHAASTPDEVLDALHARASAADYDGYFALYTDDAVFLGTDASERWPIAEFKTYTKARFATGTGWSYTPIERFVIGEGDVRWFDELLEGEAFGPCRGTGVLRRGADGEWRIVHYSLTVLVPNEIVEDVVGQGMALRRQQ